MSDAGADAQQDPNYEQEAHQGAYQDETIKHETPMRQSFKATLGQHGISTTTYPFGPEFGGVRPWKPADGGPLAPKKTTPWDPPTMRRKQYQEPLSPAQTGTLRYPMSSAIPSPSQPLPDKYNFTVKLLGAGVDGTTVPVRVKSTGTVADVITQAVHNLHASKCSCFASKLENLLRKDFNKGAPKGCWFLQAYYLVRTNFVKVLDEAEIPVVNLPLRVP
eukprot:CAMPEP_0202341796 /NCGR_PEP_ID=MMETSP1126-20121109/2633_1 /ASSEMBLY_ACC=CAM_ASM_000457 /TAXON_ID=3047 /ORGANISM="Dunaliella tertiolecta, Strain CCMP1320" /LENGTH=218 /DNA_ID=CAMNT_0048932655 /DNA_START=353 /DNA_END=1009 /DNA_ORIENTATION=+